MRRSSIVHLALALAACGPSASPKASMSAGDSAFAGVQARGGVAMGVNQYTSRHVFEPLPDGGRIALQRDVADSEGAAQIGSSDCVFFSLFLAAAGRFRLRPGVTWAAMTLSFGLTLFLSYQLDRALPALPLLSLAFLAANAGPLAERIRVRTGSPERDSQP